MYLRISVPSGPVYINEESLLTVCLCIASLQAGPFSFPTQAQACRSPADGDPLHLIVSQDYIWPSQ